MAADAQAEPAAVHELDVLVIGASRLGALAACVAAAQGAQVAVLDRRACCTSVASLPGARSVHWLSQHHALELLVDEQGRVRGASGVSGEAEKPWRVLAGAIVLAAPGTRLMAVEAGVAGIWPDLATAPGLLHVLGSSDPAQVGRAAAELALQEELTPSVRAASSTPDDLYGPAGLRPTGWAGLRGFGRQPINPFALQAALQMVAQSQARRQLEAGSAAPDGAAAAAADLARLDALWQLLSTAAPAPLGALSACRAVAERLALARWQARREVQDAQALRNAAPLRLRAFAC
ncbi:hypothetical protein [Paucibacter sp. TC2R-5]|uniref:hypothetical protein n=1 Tax=Paucibacter sp. TC2R-5 TaxID=2893555 RepID=UPI0021E5098C|nr:hypothetical protein [Paucibacter sp. TC2R-5]